MNGEVGGVGAVPLSVPELSDKLELSVMQELRGTTSIMNATANVMTVAEI